MNKFTKGLAILGLATVGACTFTGCSLTAEQEEAVNQLTASASTMVDVLEKQSAKLTREDALLMLKMAGMKMCYGVNEAGSYHYTNRAAGASTMELAENLFENGEYEVYDMYRFVDGNRLIELSKESENFYWVNVDDYNEENSKSYSYNPFQNKFYEREQGHLEKIILNEEFESFQNYTKEDIFDVKILDDKSYEVTIMYKMEGDTIGGKTEEDLNLLTIVLKDGNITQMRGTCKSYYCYDGTNFMVYYSIMDMQIEYDFDRTFALEKLEEADNKLASGTAEVIPNS